MAYAYDRFGRVTQDGALGYQYDKNGNRTQIAYPGAVAAIYTHDFADREATLSYDSGSGPQPLVTASGYKPFGPLASLALANGLTETRLFDNRYRPDRIQAGSLLDWDYTEDAVGNPTQITGTIVGQPFTANFAYQDPQYFLTQGNGPWGTRAWTYDRIGNRLTNQESGEPAQTYTYASPGHNPKLMQIAPAPGLGAGMLQFGYDAAGNQISQQQTDGEGAAETQFLDASQENKLSALRAGTGQGRSDMLYDGRGYLRQAHLTFTASPEFVKVSPTYSSEGLLMARTEDRAWTGSTPGPDGEDTGWLASNSETTQIFYFAGRPVTQLTDGPELFYLATDHLGTPVLATNQSGQAVWAGELEPFGRVYTAAADNPDPEPGAARSKEGFHLKALGRLSAESVFLRYPGQWASDAFRLGGVQGDLYYNVNRWYQTSVGAYLGPDQPKYRVNVDDEAFRYAASNPVRLYDPLGLYSIDEGCNCLDQGSPPRRGLLYQYIRAETNTWCSSGLQGVADTALRKCLRQSCQSGVIKCDDACPRGAFGYSAGGPPRGLVHWLRRNGGAPRIRTAVVCSTLPANFRGEAGNTVIHEWTHGCGYDPESGDIRGIPK